MNVNVVDLTGTNTFDYQIYTTYEKNSQVLTVITKDVFERMG